MQKKALNFFLHLIYYGTQFGYWAHFITTKAQTMAFWGKPRRPVVALGSVKSKLLKSLS